VWKHRGDLEGANQPLLRDGRWPGMGDVFAVVENLTGTGLEKSGQQVEKGSFAGAVGADQGMYAARLHFDIDVIDGRETFEILLQISGFKNDLGRRFLFARSLIVHENTPLSIQVGEPVAVGLLLFFVQTFLKRLPIQITEMRFSNNRRMWSLSRKEGRRGASLRG
jgi:hypothetical protein